jgi:hypothetical protein
MTGLNEFPLRGITKVGNSDLLTCQFCLPFSQGEHHAYIYKGAQEALLWVKDGYPGHGYEFRKWELDAKREIMYSFVSQDDKTTSSTAARTTTRFTVIAATLIQADTDLTRSTAESANLLAMMKEVCIGAILAFPKILFWATTPRRNRAKRDSPYSPWRRG